MSLVYKKRGLQDSPLFVFQLAALLDAGSFTRKFAQVVQFGSPNNTTMGNSNLFQTRGMHGERSFYTNTGCDTADGEHFTDTSTVAGDTDTFK